MALPIESVVYTLAVTNDCPPKKFMEAAEECLAQNGYKLSGGILRKGELEAAILGNQASISVPESETMLGAIHINILAGYFRQIGIDVRLDAYRRLPEQKQFSRGWE